MPAAMADDDHADTAEEGKHDGLISGLPDDVLLNILERLVMAGDAHTAARSTCVLSLRWRHLPWNQIPGVSLDVGAFYPPGGWCTAARAAAGEVPG